jgi:hypothetical protein
MALHNAGKVAKRGVTCNRRLTSTTTSRNDQHGNLWLAALARQLGFFKGADRRVSIWLPHCDDCRREGPHQSLAGHHDPRDARELHRLTLAQRTMVSDDDTKS